MLGGRFVQLDYDWSIADDKHKGMMLIGRDGEGLYQMAWTDTFHNGESIMFCTGGPELNVLGSYGSEADPAWWRTELVMPDTDHLEITAFNIYKAPRPKPPTQPTVGHFR